MKQKLAIARALLHEPSVVFLDEPTAALDPEAAYIVREAIEAIRRSGRTIVLATHNLVRGGPAVRPGRLRPRRAPAGRFAGGPARVASAAAAWRSAFAGAPGPAVGRGRRGGVGGISAAELVDHRLS